MHFSVLLLHEWDESSIMAKYCYEATSEDGADMVFDIEMNKKQAEKEYKDAIGKKGKYTKKDYPTLQDYMEGQYSWLEEDENGDWGQQSNSYGMYDWYVQGGRWANCLPSCKNDKELKALLKQALNLKDKEIAKKYRDNVDEYVKISEMPFRQACSYLQLGCTSSIQIGEVPAQYIIDHWKHITERRHSSEDAMEALINTFLIETDEETERITQESGELNSELFREKYNYYLETAKKEGREFFLTILDLHT